MVAFAIMPASAARATTITGASIAQQGGAVELHFATQGRGLGWHLTIHGQQLWIDLDHVRLQLPSRPLLGQEVAPVTRVSAIGAGITGRITVEVSGRTDYAIGRLPHELVLRVAPAGNVANLAAPILTRMERRRVFARATPSIPVRANSHDATLGDRSNAVPAIAHDGTLDDQWNATPAIAAGKREYATVSSIAGEGEIAERATRPNSQSPDSPLASSAPPDSPPTQLATRETMDSALLPNSSLRTSSAYRANSALPSGGGRQLVVIDAGHGGHDPGTEAAGDVAEKDLALQIARRVRDALVAVGVDARLTRGDDTFLTLAERTQMANRNRADLFVSIHLNSSPDPDTTGIETYYLNNTTDRATMRLARMENGVAGGYSAPGEPNLNYILTDLRQQYKANESASLARMIEAEAVSDIDASMGLRVNELGAKQGPFYVLVGALMPSVLVECGFLSNASEARLLQSAQYQQALADGIARAVIHYFNADPAVGNL
ncbi:MAG: N-acetylmuramoyl-L-alanine amidase [Candidatus Binataceae bacterium]|nr:N-acetylmuramoyl-L-alanine amidase [Candidatus Binataceae bacterium]